MGRVVTTGHVHVDYRSVTEVHCKNICMGSMQLVLDQIRFGVQEIT